MMRYFVLKLNRASMSPKHWTMEQLATTKLCTKPVVEKILPIIIFSNIKQQNKTRMPFLFSQYLFLCFCWNTRAKFKDFLTTKRMCSGSTSGFVVARHNSLQLAGNGLFACHLLELNLCVLLT